VFKVLLIILILIPAWLFSQPGFYITNDTLDEVVYYGCNYDGHNYFAISKGVHSYNVDPLLYGIEGYSYFIYKLNNDLEPIGSFKIDTINDFLVSVVKILIQNDTLYLFGTAVKQDASDTQLYVGKLSTDLYMFEQFLFGQQNKTEIFTDVIINSDQHFTISGKVQQDLYNQHLLMLELNNQFEILQLNEDVNYSTVANNLVYLPQSNSYHLIGFDKIGMFNENLSLDTTFFPEYYNRLFFEFETENNFDSEYFIGGISAQIYNYRGTNKKIKEDEYHDISWYLLDATASPIDSGFIALPEFDDYMGGMCYKSNISFLIGGVQNYHTGEQIGFEKEARWLVLQDFNLNNHAENWLFKYGGDVNYKMYGLFVDEHQNCIIYSTRYDWFETDEHERDIILIKVSENGVIVGNQENVEGVCQILVYPNPASENMHIRVKEDCIIQIRDIKGNKIYKGHLFKGLNLVQTSHFLPGIYNYSIMVPGVGSSASGKWIKK
jgi:hypothetical protein